MGGSPQETRFSSVKSEEKLSGRLPVYQPICENRPGQSETGIATIRIDHVLFLLTMSVIKKTCYFEQTWYNSIVKTHMQD